MSRTNPESANSALSAHARSRGMRWLFRGAFIALGLVALYAVLGFYAAPALLNRWIDANASRLLGRPVSIGAVQFNPFTLHLGIDRVHVAGADGTASLIDIDRVDLDAAWATCWQRALMLDALQVTHPRVELVRTAAMQWNVSDMVERLRGEPAGDAAPLRYSIANIRVRNAELHVEDKLDGATHTIENLDIDIPLLANQARVVNIAVSPLLSANVDGKPLHIAGEMKPVADSLESYLDLALDHIDLPQYLAYLPFEWPVAIPRGTLSGNVRVHVVQGLTPQVRLDGVAVIDAIAITEKDRSPIAQAQRVIASFSDVQPLLSRYHFGSINIDHAQVRYVARAGGRSNVEALFAHAKPAPEQKPGGITADRIGFVAGRFEYVDETLGEHAASMTLEDIGGAISALDTRSGRAEVDLHAQHNGGEVTTRGELDMVDSRYTGTLAAKNIGLAPLQPFLVPAQSPALVRAGRIDTAGSFYADWKAATNLHVEPATLHLRDVAIAMRTDAQSTLSLNALDITLNRFDLHAAELRIETATARGLAVRGRIERDGKLDLARMAGEPKATISDAHAPTRAPQAWHWSIGRWVLEDARVQLDDARSTPPHALAVNAIKGQVEGLNDDLSQPITLALTSSSERGSVQLLGKAVRDPFALDVKLTTREFDLTPFVAYATLPAAVLVDSAALSSEGALHFTAQDLNYSGRATLSRVRLLDKTAGEEFFAARSLGFAALEINQSGTAPARIQTGAMALDDFHANLALSADGRFNLSSYAAPSTSKGGFAHAPAASIHIDRITLNHGHLNVTDNFIKPHYTADITELAGHIGAFGNEAGNPAEVEVAGLLDANTRVDIRGRISPLAPRAFADVHGNATGVELTRFSAYAVRYTGYPIIKGRLNASVHYLLDGDKLKADNHFTIDQLTFGEESHEPGAGRQPVKLAVSLLKDANGVIDVNVPVSGSLDDPQFSIGGMIWRALGGMIGKAAKAPFRLIASAFQRDGGAEELAWIEFAPGSDQLDAAAQAKLVDIARILNAKPQLNLGIIGRTDPVLDAAGLPRVMVDAAIRREYLRDHNLDEAQAPEALSAQDTQKYLTLAYQHADFAKERRLLVLTAAQPPAEMRRLLEAHVATDDSAMLHLAERRAGHVVGFLHGKVEDRRLWTLAPQLNAKGLDDKARTTRVEMTLK